MYLSECNFCTLSTSFFKTKQKHQLVHMLFLLHICWTFFSFFHIIILLFLSSSSNHLTRSSSFFCADRDVGINAFGFCISTKWTDLQSIRRIKITWEMKMKNKYTFATTTETQHLQKKKIVHKEKYVYIWLKPSLFANLNKWVK